MVPRLSQDIGQRPQRRPTGSILLPLVGLVLGSGDKVLGPVASGVGDSAELGVAVHPDPVGEDRAGDISSEGGRRPVVHGANRDAVPVEFLGHAVRRGRLARDHTREEPLSRDPIRILSDPPCRVASPTRGGAAR